MNMRRCGLVRITLIVALLFAVTVSGCGYTLQGRADLPFTEVSIGEIENKTPEPKVQDRMHRLLAETMMEYGVDVRNSSRYRIEGEILKFDVHPVAERDLQAIEYRIEVTGNFKIVDTETLRADVKSGAAAAPVRKLKPGEKKALYKEEDLGSVSNPYLTYFRSSGLLVDVLAAKETATDKALKDLSQELVLRIIYKMPKAEAGAKKGKARVEPQTVPAGSR
jgi:outer membrane lipopolysaccharide assembly protein LptE/RlpB